MSAPAYFRVDPRLAAVLGEGYRSSEQALKELVDNAWDADATEVHITLSPPVSNQSIVVRDNGTGMTENEVRGDYLSIATDRRSRKGNLTAIHKRQVKGRKGIGKFAGLMLADQMEVETRARGLSTTLAISKEDLLLASDNEQGSDLERINLPLQTKKISDDEHGTTVTLSRFNLRLTLPTSERMRHLLVEEYGSAHDFEIFVDGSKVDIEDIQGELHEEFVDLPGVGLVKMRVVVCDGPKSLKQSGIVIRVQGKIIGQRAWHGVENDETIPAKLRKKAYIEVEADGLHDATTADWGGFIENNRAFAATIEWAKSKLKERLNIVHKKDMQLAQARVNRQIQARLAALPEYRREAVQRALDRILAKFYDDKIERTEAIISIVSDALEKDEYWQVVEKISAAKHRDVEAFAEALAAFGLLELSLVGQQTPRRLAVLDDLDELVSNPDTKEKDVHLALENNLWIFGPVFSLMSSNRTLKQIVKTYTDGEFEGERANKRPDLLLMENPLRRYMLLEFKRPNHPLTREDELQAVQYRDDLSSHFHHVPIDVKVIGGRISDRIVSQYSSSQVELMSYVDLISTARSQLNWLIQNIQQA